MQTFSLDKHLPGVVASNQAFTLFIWIVTYRVVHLLNLPFVYTDSQQDDFDARCVQRTSDKNTGTANVFWLVTGNENYFILDDIKRLDVALR